MPWQNHCTDENYLCKIHARADHPNCYILDGFYLSQVLARLYHVESLGYAVYDCAFAAFEGQVVICRGICRFLIIEYIC